MFKATSWFKARSFSEGRGPVPSVVPFIAVLDLGAGLDQTETSAQPVLSARDFRQALETLRPGLTRLFVRVPESWPLLEWFELLAGLEALGLPYHLETQAPWQDPGQLLGRFQSLERLDRLRVHLNGFEDLEMGTTYEHIQMAIDAGLNLWAILPLEAAGSPDLEFHLALDQTIGVRGLSFRIPDHIEPARAAEILPALAKAYLRGYRVHVEGCLPAERPPVIRHLPRACAEQKGFCFVDGRAQVWTCPHAVAPLGSLLEASLETLWARIPPPPEDSEEVFPEPSSSIHLEESLRPLARCEIRKEPIGALLIRGYDFMPVTNQGLMVVRAFDGKQTLRQLDDSFGKEATPLAFALLQRGMLRFMQSDGDHA